MDTDFNVSIWKFLYGKSVVKVFCVKRVYCTCRDLSEIPPLRILGFLREHRRAVFLQIFSVSDDTGREVTREPLSKRESAHLCLVHTCLTYHFFNNAERIFFVGCPFTKAN